MKSYTWATLFATGMLCASAIMAEEPTYNEVWTCKLEEDKKIEDVQAANSSWLKWINEKVDGGKITSSVVTSVVGNSDMFLFVDSYPYLATWSAAKAALDTKEGEAMEEVFTGISECSENRLYKTTLTE